MFSHYLKIAIRNIAKYKAQSIIAVLSIALGMVFCSLTLMWIRYERSYDSFYRNADDIHLVMSLNPSYAGQSFSCYTAYPDGTYLAEKYPQIEDYSRCMSVHYNVFRDGNVVADLSGLCVDDNYQDFFDIKVLEGDNILNLSKNEAALTKTQADRLYNGGSAIGQMLYTGQGFFTIKSVIEDSQSPSSFPYDILTGYDLEKFDSRGYIASNLFVRVSNENLNTLAQEIETDTIIYNGSMTLSNGYEVTWQEKHEMKYKLLPLSKVREEGLIYEVQKNVSLHYVYILMLLGVVLIVCALTNYFTLFVTKIRMRVREISLRYANGAGMRQIVMLFCTEIMIVLLISLLAGTVICVFALPFFKTLSVMDKPVNFILMSYLLTSIVIGIMSVLISLFFITMTGRKQLTVYFGNSAGQSVTAIGYKISIGFQLAVSLCSIFCSVIISRQLDYLLESSDMGYKKHNVGFCYQYGMSEADVMTAKEKLKMMPELEKVVYGFNPTSSYSSYSSVNADTIGSEAVTIRTVMIKANRDYLDLIEVEPVSGELFSQEEQSNVILINETLANLLGGVDNIVGKEIISLNSPYIVKGVVKDLCYLDPKNEIPPLVYEYKKEDNETGVNANSYFLFKYKEGVKWNDLQRKIEDTMREIRPNASYNSQNMEISYMAYIKSESMLNILLITITLICVIIAVSGLYSIVALLCQKRRKEIAIRKINGARMSDILRMFLKEYLPIIILSAIAAFSVGATIMHRWLSHYVRQTPITIWVYLSVFVCMLLIIGLTVFGNIRRAMIENPADVIKSE